MKFKLKISVNQPEKDFISKVRDSLDEVKYMINEANGIKEVLKSYDEGKVEHKSINIEYKEDFLTNTIVKIKMDDLMAEYLKERLNKIEKEIKERVVSNETI